MSDDDSGQSVNLPVSVATRISSRDDERLEQYMDQEDLGKSVAARRLIRTALDQELETEQDDTSTAEGLGEALLLTGLAVAMLLLMDNITGTTWTAGTTALLIVGYLLKFKTEFVLDRLL